MSNQRREERKGMSVLAGLEPAEVFRYFEEICRIPHGSGNTKQISDYCVAFARRKGLRYLQDDSNNVILFQDGTAGYETSAPVIIQGHLDMVCEKTADSPIDFEKDALTLCVEGDDIYAQKTTLGGDDGIAVAYGLALLDARDIAHPPLEVVFTTDEETGMCGAAALDCTPLKARAMLNLDSEDEGVLLVSCAGGCRVTCHLPIQREEREGVLLTLSVGGLTGGHSGVEIDKGRANANQLMGRLLLELKKTAPYALIRVSGGQKDNAIPRDAFARLLAKPEAAAALQKTVERYQEIFRSEFQSTDPALFCTLQTGETESAQVMEENSREAVIAALLHLPGGVMRMSSDIPGLVQTSLNLGILETLEEEVRATLAVRSSVETQKEELVDRIGSLMELLGGTTELQGDYPAWEYNRDSRLRELMTEVFREQYGRMPSVQAIHAGLECGLFAGKIPGLDCVSFGPEIRDIHTTGERLSIASVQRTWKYLLEILRRLK